MESDYREIMRSFYSRIAKFIQKRPEIIEELSYEENYLKYANINEEDRRNLIFDWYLFDYKSKVLKKNLLQHFLEKEMLEDEVKTLYSGFRNSIYSVFEIKAIRTGKELLIYDLINGKEYNVKDTSITQHPIKGQLAILRVIPFKDFYILTGAAHLFPKPSIGMLKLSLLEIKNMKKPVKLTPLMILELFSKKDDKEKLPTFERFRLFCREGSLENEYIDEIIQKTKERVKNKGDFNDIIEELMTKIKPFPGFKPKEITEAYMDVWNSFVEGAPGYVDKGPIESTLVLAGLRYAQQKVNPNKFKNITNASEKAEKAIEKWLKTPHEELNNKTPEKAILEERKKLGNPEKRIKFRINISQLAPGEEIDKRAKETFDRAIKLLGENKPTEAIEVYKEHLSIHSRNYVAWQNMGLAYILLCDKPNAERCFKKALDINPDYKVARDNMKILKNATQKDIERMARDYRVKMVNVGKEMEMGHREDNFLDR